MAILRDDFGIEKSLISRDIKLVANEKQILYSVDLPQNSQWQFAFQESGASGGVGTLHINYASMISELDNEVSFGRFGGDIITGFGSVTITGKADSFGDVQLDSFFTTQSLSIDTGSFQVERSFGAVTGNYENVTLHTDGWCPFPFNTFQLFSNAPFDMRFRNGSNVTIFEKTGVTDEFFNDRGFPPQAYMQIKATVANQVFNIVFKRKD